jgi:hypothetical protein
MSKDRLARVLALSIIAGAIGVAVIRRKPSRAQEPQDAVYAMLDAARAGDVKQYLASYTGPMETALRRTLSETREPAQYLKDSNAAIKGVAISDAGQVSDAEVKLRVEFVYQDRNEVQMMYLDKIGSGWKIVRADSEERVKTLIPYGTPVK